MPNIYDLPPAPRGSAEEQLNDLRNYLVRLSNQLADAVQSPIVTVQSNSRAGPIIIPSAGGASGDIKDQIAPLRELIIKTAKEIKVAEDRITTVLQSDYLAVSTFGEYKETARLALEETAAKINESYEKSEELISRLNGETNYMISKIQGQIQRGFVRIGTNEYFGIAISDHLDFGPGMITQDNGETYREIVGQINCGLYTASGWIFFLNGQRAGWFDSHDGLLHVENIYIESSLRMGNWLISTGEKWGIRYVGN